ncbi:MAG TPA: hypothetical protein PK016_07825 [Candidatus Atribacteria bacterium]|nr:hypothetical protein [Candidatus Atribacteria bacterium]
MGCYRIKTIMLGKARRCPVALWHGKNKFFCTVQEHAIMILVTDCKFNIGRDV